MFALQTSLNSLGLLATIVGVVLIYLNSPLNFSGIDGGDASTDYTAIERATASKNKRMKVGTALVILGTLFQLASNYTAAAAVPATVAKSTVPSLAMQEKCAAQADKSAWRGSLR